MGTLPIVNFGATWTVGGPNFTESDRNHVGTKVHLLSTTSLTIVWICKGL